MPRLPFNFDSANVIALILTIISCLLLLKIPASAQTCSVREGVVAEVASGAFSSATETVTLKSTDRAEFRWDISDKEAVGWMRIVAEDGREIGWVPAGHEAIQCGGGD